MAINQTGDLVLTAIDEYGFLVVSSLTCEGEWLSGASVVKYSSNSNVSILKAVGIL